MSNELTIICKKCNINKPYFEFYKASKYEGFRSKCKTCYLEESKKQKAVYRSKLENKLKATKYNREYWEKHKEIDKEKYKLKREKYKEKRNLLRREKYKNNVHYNIEHRYRTRVQSLLRHHKFPGERNFDYLGCTKKDFIQYIETFFNEKINWNNKNEWHLDHILPCCSFDLSKEEDKKKCFHYTNLRPLLAKDNREKIKSDLKLKNKNKNNEKTN